MKKLKGKVVSTKMNKTVTVKVERKKMHPVYKKILTRSKKYLVHESVKVKEGDKVVIGETSPISKKKQWKILEVLDK